MKRTIFTVLLIFIGCISFAQVQSTDEPNLKGVLTTIFNKAKQYSVYRTKVDWNVLASKVLNDNAVLSKAEFEEKVKLIFNALGDRHAMLLFNGKKLISGNNMNPIVVRPALKEPLKNGPVGIKTQILESGYGYILIPGTRNSDRQTCQQLQDSICSLNLKELKGIIIDLRLNEGGSIYPLFTGLNQLFEAKVVGYNSNLTGQLSNPWTIKAGKYGQNGQVVASVKNKCTVDKNIKIAILTSQITASAGEILAVAFKGRDHTVFIGETTYGLTTLNAEFSLGKYYLALSTAFIADRNQKVYHDNIIPDIKIIEGDDFKNLQQDTKVLAALNWFKTH